MHKADFALQPIESGYEEIAAIEFGVGFDGSGVKSRTAHFGSERVGKIAICGYALSYFLLQILDGLFGSPTVHNFIGVI